MHLPMPSSGQPRRRCLASTIAACLLSIVVPGSVNAAPALPTLTSALSVSLPSGTQSAAAAQPNVVRAPAMVMVTNCNDDGPGSLRVVAGSAASGTTVDMSQLTCSTISLQSGAVYMFQESLTLHGPGRARLTISGDRYSSSYNGLLRHAGAGTFTVQGVALTYGRKYTSDRDALGGCIFSAGTIALEDASLSDCRTRSAGSFAARGGGLFSGMASTVSHSDISDSEARVMGTGESRGGGIYASGNLGLTASGVFANDAVEGGGIFARGDLVVVQSTIAGNQAYRYGGIASMPSVPHGVLLSNSTIADNFAQFVGGMYTIGSATLRHVTIANNGSGPAPDAAAGLQSGVATLTLEDTIIADNQQYSGPARLDSPPKTEPSDLGGPPGAVVDGHTNLVVASFLTLPSDTLRISPQLGALGDNGGTTPTMALAATSPAVDADHVIPLDSDGFQDQRGPGFRRYVSGHGGPRRSDIGAFELDPDRIFTTGMDIRVYP